MSDSNFYRADEYANALTGLGGPVDKHQFTFFQRFPELEYEELDAMYEQSSMAARIVDRLPDDMTREGFRLVGADESVDMDYVLSKLDDLQAMQCVADSVRWSRLYGGAILVLAVNDGRKLNEPLDLENVRNIVGLRVVESRYVLPQDIDPGLGSANYRHPKYYQVLQPFGNASEKLVHHTRCVRFDGLRVPPTRLASLGTGRWGPSVLQRVYAEISQLGSVMGYMREVMHMASILVFNFEDYRKQLCASPGGDKELQQLSEAIRLGIDNLHSINLDTQDQVSFLTRDLGGFEALVNKFVDALVRATDMPRTVLLGEQPSGLNASADSEIRSWYDYVASQQRVYLTPALTRIIDVCLAVQQNTMGREAPEEYRIEYDPLWQPTESEQAATELQRAQAMLAYAQAKAVAEGSATAQPAPEGEVADAEEPIPDQFIPPGTRLVGPGECAKMLGVSAATVRKMAKAGKIPATMVGGRLKLPIDMILQGLTPAADNP